MSEPVTSPNLEFLVCELLLHLSQLSLFALQALLQGLHLPQHLLFVLPDCHFQLGQLRIVHEATVGNNKKIHYITDLNSVSVCSAIFNGQNVQ